VAAAAWSEAPEALPGDLPRADRSNSPNRRPGAALKARKARPKKDSPFVECDDRGQRRQNLRRWLTEDQEFARARALDLRKQKLLKQQLDRTKSAEQLAETRVYWNSYSIALREAKIRQSEDQGAQQARKAAAERAQSDTRKGRRRQGMDSAASAIKDMQARLKESLKSLDVVVNPCAQLEDEPVVALKTMLPTFKGAF